MKDYCFHTYKQGQLIPAPPDSQGWTGERGRKTGKNDPAGRCPHQGASQPFVFTQDACPERTPSAIEVEVEGLREAHPLER